MTNYFDWMGAGFIEGKGHGMAMHEAQAIIKGCYYGFNERSLFLRVDVGQSFIADMKDVSFEISLLMKETYKVVYHVKDNVIEGVLPVRIGFSEVLEMEVPFDAFGAKMGDKVTIWVCLKIKEMIVDRIPKRGYLAVPVPSENFEMEMWYV